MSPIGRRRDADADAADPFLGLETVVAPLEVEALVGLAAPRVRRALWLVLVTWGVVVGALVVIWR